MNQATVKTNGFTLIELMVVIIVVGVLSVTAYSKFVGKDGVIEFTYQARVISALRNMQMRAMQDTRPNYCFHLNFVNGANPNFGPPELITVLNQVFAPSCGGGINSNEDNPVPEFLRAESAAKMAEDGVSLSVLDLSTLPDTALTQLGFDNLGRPVVNSNFDPNNPANTHRPVRICTSNVDNQIQRCEITITGEAEATICIESEGYIYAC